MGLRPPTSSLQLQGLMQEKPPPYLTQQLAHAQVVKHLMSSAAPRQHPQALQAPHSSQRPPRSQRGMRAQMQPPLPVWTKRQQRMACSRSLLVASSCSWGTCQQTTRAAGARVCSAQGT
jgi:hypothetical protein